jgi:hypothetical protein
MLLCLLTSFGAHGTIGNRIFVQEPQIAVVEHTEVIAELDTHLGSIMHLEGKCSSINWCVVVGAEYGVAVLEQSVS